MEQKNPYKSSLYSLMATLFFLLLFSQAVFATKEQRQWRGYLNYTLNGYTVEQVWPLVENYCDLYKVFANLLASFCVKGVPGRAGQVRYVVYDKPAPPGRNFTERVIGWERHKLLEINHKKHYVYYVMTGNNFVMNNYYATMKVSPAPKGTLYEWFYRVDPIDEYTADGFYNLLSPFFRNAMKNAERILRPTN